MMYQNPPVTSDQEREMYGEDDFGMYRAFRESPPAGVTPSESSSTDVSPGRGLPEGLEYVVWRGRDIVAETALAVFNHFQERFEAEFSDEQQQLAWFFLGEQP